MKIVKLTVLMLMLFNGFVVNAQNMGGMKMPSTTKKATPAPVVYTCVMHPEIHRSKPGNCPICGMKLIVQKPKVIKPKTIATPPKTSTGKIDNMKGMNMSSGKKIAPVPAPVKKATIGKMDNMPGMKIPATARKTIATSHKPTAGKMDDMTGMKMPAIEEKKSSANAPKPGSSSDMSGMEMKMPSATVKAPVVYTCVMHPQIHRSKPGNCPICGMKLVVEKPKAPAPKKAADNMVGMNGMEPATGKPDNMAGMQMQPQDTKAAAKDGEKKSDEMPGMGMSGMQMGDNSGTLENIKAAKAKLGTVKTIVSTAPPRVVRYDLYVADTIVNYTGKKRPAIAINGSIPAPTLYFTEGDTAEIYVHNTLPKETSIHWHGLILPNQFDGVPYLTTQPILPGQTHLFKFPIVQNGTYWYHSHTKTQEQSGMYGALILKKRAEPDYKQLPLVLSDWADMMPHEIERSLHNQTDWFAIRKNTVQSYAEAIKTGHLKTKITNEWKRMNAMDVSDVAYDRFLINGKPLNEQPQFKAGDKVKLRVVNGGASSYFWLTFGGGKIIIVANDGEDVEPVEVDRLIVAVAETYDIIVTIPENKSYEFLVTPEDRTKSASLWLGTGERISAPRLPTLKYFAGMKMMNEMMDMSGNMIPMKGMDMSNQIMDMNTVMYPEITGEDKTDKQAQDTTEAKNEDKMSNMPGMDMGMKMDMGSVPTDIVTLNYGMLRATKKSTLPNWPTRTLEFELTGNMNRYVWTIDNKTVSEADKILIHKGENIRIVLYNNTMMRHPMHLHGHFFRVLNGQGEYAPLKNVLDIMPMERDTIEFATIENGGDWFFHCHILYHMMSGMGRIFSYENTPPNPEIPNPQYAQRKLFQDDRIFHPMARIGIESSGTDGEAMFANTRWKASTMWHLGMSRMEGYESETMVGRYIGKMQWWYPYAGFDYHYKTFNPAEKNIFGSDYRNMFGQISNKDNRKTGVIGVAYTLPMLFVADARLDGDGKYRFQLSREDIPVAKRMRANLVVNTDKEYAGGLRYILTKYISLSSHYDSDMGLGGGLSITY